MTVFLLGINKLEGFQHVAERVRMTGMERGEGVVQNARVFAGETFADQFFEFRQVQIKHLGDEAEGKNVFTFVLGRAADGFNRQAGNGNAKVMIRLFEFLIGHDMVGIV